jgi:hypothetical protein
MNQEHLTLCSSAEWAEAVQRWIIPWVLESVDLGDDVLEFGPGPGLTTDVLRARVARLTAVEIHPDLAAALAARLANTNVELHRSARRHQRIRGPVPRDQGIGSHRLQSLNPQRVVNCLAQGGLTIKLAAGRPRKPVPLVASEYVRARQAKRTLGT